MRARAFIIIVILLAIVFALTGSGARQPHPTVITGKEKENSRNQHIGIIIG